MVKKEEIKHEIPTGMQGFFINTRKDIFKNRIVRKALNYAFDFEWTNKILFFNQYKRTNSFFSNSDLASLNLPTKEELKLLEPFTFAMDISVCCDIAALMVTANSGADVPKATTVSPITKSDTFRVCAISEAESTNQSAPFQSMITEMITRIQSMII